MAGVGLRRLNILEYEPVGTKRYREVVLPSYQLTPEQRFWQGFKPVVKDLFEKLTLPTLSVQISKSNDLLLYANGSILSLYDLNETSNAAKLNRTFTKFKSAVLKGVLRADNKVLVASDESGRVSILDAAKGSMLRKLKFHKEPVHDVMFLNNNGSYVFTCGDDGKCSMWDIPSKTMLVGFKAHDDHIRSCCNLSQSIDDSFLVATGSYDGTVKLWDLRKEASPASTTEALRFERIYASDLVHDDPVEAICTLGDSERYLVSAAKSGLTIWDVRSPKEPVKFSNGFDLHHRAITSVDVCEVHEKDIPFLETEIEFGKKRIVTGSLDGTVGIHAFDGEKITNIAHITERAAVMSVAIAKDASVMVTGYLSGGLAIHKKPKEGTISKTLTEDLIEDELVLNEVEDLHQSLALEKALEDQHKKPKFTKYDLHLKKFQYKSALTEVLKTEKPFTVVAVLEELKQRAGLEAALKNRIGENLDILLKFFTKHITQPQYAIRLAPVLEIFLALYGNDDAVLSSLAGIEQDISAELELQEELEETCGVLELVLSNLNSQT